MKTISLIPLLISVSAYAGSYDNPYAAGSAVYKVEVVASDKINLGTGVLVGSNKILTNCHVVNNPGVPRVTHRNTKQVFKVSRWYTIPGFDACVLQGEFTQGRPVSVGGVIDDGQPVWHYGYPRGVEGVGQGVIIHVGNETGAWVIQSTSFCNPGSSGGPLLDVHGNLIGLNYGVYNNRRDACLSIPAFLLQSYF